MPIQAFCSRILLLFLLVAGALSNAGWASEYPLTLKDSLGREVSLATAPQRLVCLLSSVTDLLFELDRTEILVGLSRQDLLNHSALRVPSMGSFFQPDLIAISNAKPDLIIASTSQQAMLQPWLDDPQQHTKVLFFREGSLADGLPAWP